MKASKMSKVTSATASATNSLDINRNIKFRILFVSPYFELEVKCASGMWQSVHSQNGTPSVTVGNIIMYPMLRFRSYQSALMYANETLGLTNLSTSGFFGLLASPPASYMRQQEKGITIDSSSTMLSSTTEII